MERRDHRSVPVRGQLCIAGVVILLVGLATASVAGAATRAAVELGSDDYRLSHMGPDGSASYGGTVQARSDLAYNSAAREYLVVWDGDHNGGTQVAGEIEILGQRVNAETGAPIGSIIRISFMGPTGNTAYWALTPAVAYNSVEDEYFVVWRGEHNAGALVDGENEIWGQRLDAATGALVGSLIRISYMGPDGNASYDAYEPDVAFNATDNVYQVVWDGDHNVSPLVDNEFEVFGRKVAADGSFPEAQLRWSAMGTNGDTTVGAYHAAVAWASEENLFLAVWQGNDDVIGDGQPEIFGEVENGAPGGFSVINNFRISTMGPEGSSLYGAEWPDVDYDPVDSVFLVVWAGDDDVIQLVSGELEVWARKVSAVNGSLLEVQLRLSVMGTDGDPTYDAMYPAVAYCPAVNQFLTVWQGSAPPMAADEAEVFGQLITGTVGFADFYARVRISAVGTDGDTGYFAEFPGVACSPWGDSLVAWWGNNETVSLAEREIYGQRLRLGVFYDGFESGSGSAWSSTVP